MAGRTGQGGADAPVYFKPLELCLVRPLTHLGSEPGDAAAPPLRVRALVIARVGRKVVLNRAERERAFGRIVTERGARPPGLAAHFHHLRHSTSTQNGLICQLSCVVKTPRGLSFGLPGAVKGETL